MATYTFGTIKDRVYETLGVQSDSANFPIATVEREINDLISKVVNGRVVSLIEKDPYGNDKVYAVGDLSFRRRKKFYTYIDSQVLGASVTTASTTLSFDTTNFPTTGAVYIGGEVISYTGKTSTVLTGVTLIANHNTGDTIYPLYAMPSDITRPYTFGIVDGYGDLQELPVDDNRFGPFYRQYFSVVTNNSGTNFILLRGYKGEEGNLQLTYLASPTAMVNDSDVCIIPDEYCSLVWNIVAGTLNYRMSEINDAQLQLKAGYSVLSEMYGYYNSTTAKPRNRIKLQPIRGIGIYGTRNRYR